ncbi:predicted protein, partial [Arabidopsis lyrata subsp. lyrata]
CGGVEVSSRVERNRCITDEKWLCRAVTSELKKTTGDFAVGAWAGAAHYLLWYMLASHITGAFWYMLSVERNDTCWRFACKFSQIRDSVFRFCIVGSSKSQRLSSRAANKYISRRGFVFQRVRSRVSSFALLLGNMLTVRLHLLTVRLEEMRIKRCDSEQYHRSLPQNLRERVRRYDQYKWLETRGVKEENLVQSLATDLRRDIKRHLCLSLVRRVPLFANMNERLLDNCERLKPSLYKESTFIVREGNPVNEMMFIIRGRLESVTLDVGRSCFFNRGLILKEGDFCGDKLLTWALDLKAGSILPSSTRT